MPPTGGNAPAQPGLHHGLAGERTLMRIHVGEADRYDGQLLYEAIVDVLRRQGLAGATVTQCVMGFGATHSLHSLLTEIGALDMPVVIECVDHEERIQSVLPELDGMIGGGLITLERAAVIMYRAERRGAGPEGAP
jgi:PII-like signaling protein